MHFITVIGLCLANLLLLTVSGARDVMLRLRLLQIHNYYRHMCRPGVLFSPSDQEEKHLHIPQEELSAISLTLKLSLHFDDE